MSTILKRMTIEQFIAQSVGKWRSMRSGHSLAFQQFEDVLSEVRISYIEKDDSAVQDLLSTATSNQGQNSDIVTPFRMDWSAESDWEPEDSSQISSGSCLIIPLKKNDYSGILIRSVGYAESELAESAYQFLDDGTFLLSTYYEQSIAEERIWFVSDNGRCRSSVLKTSAGSGVLQTSFASEVRRVKA